MQYDSVLSHFDDELCSMIQKVDGKEMDRAVSSKKLMVKKYTQSNSKNNLFYFTNRLQKSDKKQQKCWVRVKTHQ